MAENSNIHLYTAQTPNGIKVSILLEELGLKYDVTAIDISKNTQKEPWFLEINPNGRIPAMTDTFTDGAPIRLFESGSIMQYLVDRYDKDHKVSYPHGSREYYEINNWLMWQMGGLGPMQGQLNHFNRACPGDRCTIADIACWGWVAAARWAGVDMAEFPVLNEWVKRMLARPGFEKGRHVPSRHTQFDNEKLSEEEISKMAEATRNWVQASMKEEAK
ncbi:hypothetical protein DL768_002346 [Monosporascus sp. mg162]|nr:hypothetical protein DL768_002346 [Monosporascus sp. mg162]